MGAYQSTLAGWAVVIALVAFVARNNWQKSRTVQPARPEAPRGRQERPAEKAVKPKETKPKEQKQKAKKQPKAAPAAAPAPAPVAAPAAPAPKSKPSKAPSSDDERASDLEFARQLAIVKQGTKFVGKAKDENRQKTVKQSRADEERISAPSSTAGIDADDDRSSAAPSPTLGPVEAGNVDDMLEKAAPGPSVLRLVGTEEKTKSQKPKAAAEPAETKKQRQNRQKAELAKVQREEAEKERKVKLEAQRRVAREAEGRAAKDGSAFMAAQAQKNSAWTEANGSNGAAAVSQPLDTFDAAPKAAPKAAAASKPVSAAFDKKEEWVSSLPSEEEQIQMIRDEESWSTVKTKTRKAKKQDKENTAADAAAPAAAAAKTEAPAAALAPPQTRPAIATKSSFDVLKVSATADDQEETEWDV